MKGAISLVLTMILAGCATRDSDTSGVAYSGKANLSNRLHEFTASNADTKKDIVLTMTGSRELTFSFNDKISHIDYEKDIIIIRSETDNSEWSARRVKGGFELEDGTLLQCGSCRGWAICLHDTDDQPILKGKYSLQGNGTQITLWISEDEKHIELLGLMANALFNKSKNKKQSIESALETLSTQVWTY